MKIHLIFILVSILHSEVSAGMKRNRHSHEKIASDALKNTLLTHGAFPSENELRVTSPMKNQSTTSGGKIQFKCKIGVSNENIHFAWFKDNALIDMAQDPRVTITTKPWGSRLRIKDVFTLDTGAYKCEASNEHKRVETSAYLKVEFERPPPPNKKERSQVNFPRGKCEKYRGLVCANMLNGVNIFVDSFENQEEMEGQIKQTLTQISNSTFSSDACRKSTLPAFCHFVFTPCHIGKKGDIKRGNRLCREDCQLLKHDVCHKEFIERNENSFLEILFNSANCSHLPSKKDSDCVRIGVGKSKMDQECYHVNGESYRGNANATETGEKCQVWPLDLAAKHTELLGGHNFCRNPGNQMGKPWCFVDDKKTKMVCNVKLCEMPYETSRNMVILLVLALSIACIIFGVVLCCIYSRAQKRFSNARTFTKKTSRDPIETALLSTQKRTVLPRVTPTSIKFLVEIGAGEYGKIYKGTISDDPRFYEKTPFAFKVLESGHLTSKFQSFERDMESLSKLSHPYITNLKAFVMDQKIKVLVFEFTNQVNLHEHLLLNSPASDFSKSPTYLSNGRTGISMETLVKMAFQISSGMEYLSNNRYIHRDLAARNILVCGNTNLKISNLGMQRDTYFSCYHKTPSGQFLPIRWMAPESLQNGQFSNKSTVWSFGVLLWEMFSYGMQPYCGYNNYEVLDVISRHQLLSCPDRCPAKIYSLMRECWKTQPSQRLAFADIRSKFETFQSENNNFPSRSSSFATESSSVEPPRYHAVQAVPSTWERKNRFSEKSLLF